MKTNKCLICLEVSQYDYEDKNFKNLSELKFQALSCYLGLRSKGFLWRQASVCKECRDLLDKFRVLYQCLETQRMKVNACLRQIHNVMVEGNCYDHEDEDEDEEENRTCEQDDLRQEIIRKCLANLKKWEPKVSLSRLRFFATGGSVSFASNSNSSTPRPSSSSICPASTSSALPSPIKSDSISFSEAVSRNVSKHWRISGSGSGPLVPYMCSPPPSLEEFPELNTTTTSDQDYFALALTEGTEGDDGDDFYNPAEAEDLVVDLNPSLSTESTAAVATATDLVETEVNEEWEKNFISIGRKDLGNGAHENYYHCLICKMSSITDTTEHMRLNHLSNQNELEPKPMEELSTRKGSKRPVAAANDNGTGGRDRDATATIGKRQLLDLEQVPEEDEPPTELPYHHRRQPLPEYIIRKECIWKYGQKTWNYYCRLCNTTFSGLLLTQHKRRHSSDNLIMRSIAEKVLEKSVKRRSVSVPEPEPRKTRRGLRTLKPKPSADVEVKEGSSMGNTKRRKAGRPMNSLPEHLIRKERFWNWKNTKMCWKYYCQTCDFTFLAKDLPKHRPEHSPFPRESTEAMETGTDNGETRAVKMKTFKGLTKMDTTEPMPMRQNRRRKITALPNYIVRKERIIKYGRLTWNLYCKICEKTFIGLGLTQHKQKHSMITTEEPGTDLEKTNEGLGKVKIRREANPKKVYKVTMRENRPRRNLPLPEYIVRKERVFKYGQKNWVYYCKLCNKTFIGLALTQHKQKHSQLMIVNPNRKNQNETSPNGTINELKCEAGSFLVQPTQNLLALPDIALTLTGSIDDDKVHSDSTGIWKSRRRVGRPLAPLPEHITRKEQIWSYGKKEWNYFCKNCQETFTRPSLSQHKLCDKTFSGSDSTGLKRKHFVDNGRRYKVKTKVKGTYSQSKYLKSKERESEDVKPTSQTRKRREGAPDFMKRTGTVRKYGRRLPLYLCTLCNISTVLMTQHKRTHEVTKFPCPSCPMNFKQKRKVMEHISKEHGDIIFHNYRKPSTEEIDFRNMVGEVLQELDSKAVIPSRGDSRSIYRCLFCHKSELEGEVDQKDQGQIQFKLFMSWRNHLFEKHREEIGLKLEKLQEELQELQEENEEEEEVLSEEIQVTLHQDDNLSQMMEVQNEDQGQDQGQDQDPLIQVSDSTSTTPGPEDDSNQVEMNDNDAEVHLDTDAMAMCEVEVGDSNGNEEEVLVKWEKDTLSEVSID